jgi:hypothetical protein
MPLNFNVDPYYDDFDATKNYHRILFKPGYAVQARELTQSQSILQDQITKFANNIFKQNSPVTGGQITTNLSNAYYIKLNPTINGVPINLNHFAGISVQNATGTVVAQVLAVVAAVPNADPDTLIVTYKTGTHFGDNDFIIDANDGTKQVQAYTTSSTGLSSVASIAQGVFYISSNYNNSYGVTISNGNFVQVNPQTVVLDKYGNYPNLRIGLQIDETIYDYINDSTLLDPAVGASNYQAPGADRYVITLTLETRPLTLGDDDKFIELVRVTNGQIAKIADGSVYNVIDDYFAKRDYETNGDYVVNDFQLTPKTYSLDSTKYNMSVGTGVAYVHGYRVESTVPTDIITNRARTTGTQSNNPVFMNYGSFFYVDTVIGANGSSFDITTYQPIDFHNVTTANIATGSSTSYNSTLVASGYLRGLAFDHAGNNSVANTWVYRAYVSDLQLNAPSANVISATTSTVTLPSYYSTSNSAYVGVNISIITGTDAGDVRTITAYNGVTKVATINQNWTATPDSTSVFVINYRVDNIQSVANTSPKTSYPLTVYASALIDPESKTNGLASGATMLEDTSTPELLFPVGAPYVSSVSNATFTTQQVWRNITFTSTGSGVAATLPYTGDYTGIIHHFGTPNQTYVGNTSNLPQQNYAIIVTNKGSSNFNVGDNVPWTTSGRTLSLDSTAATATLTATDAGGQFTATVIAKVSVINGDDKNHILKTKTLITANTNLAYTTGTQVNSYTYVDDTTITSTGQVYIQNAGLVAPGSKQSLYLSDVKNIVKILDSGSTGTTPTTAGLSGYNDITSNYIFDSGQKDNYYDHASITLKTGAPSPIGNILVFVNYYQHSGGDGYFDVNSYTNETYQIIPKYTAKNGITYALRDCLDFRPARKNAQTSFVFRYSNSATNYGIFLPTDLSVFTNTYSFYLGRLDKLVLTKDKKFKMIEGVPSLNPIFPSQPDGSLVIAQLTHKPYTGYIPTEAPAGYVPDLSISKVKHKRYTMQDIAGIEDRINNIEYYTSLNLLEQKASSLQISDAYGLNRFKNGIMVDDFSSYAVADTLSNDYGATINRRTRQLTATQNVKNFPLKALALVYNMGLPSTATSATLGYAINNESYVNYFTLPVTGTQNVALQRFASRTTNVNPFSFSNQEGVVSLSPNMDNWVDTSYAPSLLITDPNLQVFRSDPGAVNVLSAGDWQTVSGTSSSSSFNTEGHGINPSPYGFVGYTTTKTATVSNQVQSNILGAYDNIGNTYSLNNGYITDVSILPYIRPAQIVVRAKNMLFQTTITHYFDNTSIDKYVRKTNVIELTGVSGSFNEDDVIGYFNSPTFTPTGRVVGVYVYPGTSGTQVRLYVAGDPFTTTSYAPSGTFQNAYFSSAGVYQNSTASGTIASTRHHAGRIQVVNSTTSLKLSTLANTTDNWYTGNTINICAGSGVGYSATISGYTGSTQTVTLATSIPVGVGDIYSIGGFKTNEEGAHYGVFNLPAGIFHTGQRTLRIDNSINGNQNTATTYASGTYYASGLQTKSQQVDFGASPAGAKNTFTQTNSQTLTNVQTYVSPWDPIAQTFVIDGSNYPNGVFLNNIKVFFRTKPSDNSTVTLSIVGTLNGYPNGATLDHSIVTISPSQVNVSETPHYLDSTTYTTFTFDSPVYIQPNQLYAFILKTNSNAYTVWTASNGDNAISSSVKNLPTDVTPSIITKIGSAPYVGALFVSQNSQTWNADQNQSLMFNIDRSIFDTTATPSIQFVVPAKLPQRTLIDQSIGYYLNANSISSSIDAVSNTNILVDAFNVTSTDFVPSATNVLYNYNATLASGSAAGQTIITPGKYGTSSLDNIYLNDNQGERVLIANSSTSFSLYAQLTSTSDAVTPVISDAGTSLYAITWNINNCPLSNSLIQVVNGGSNYSGSPTVTISAPTGASGTQAYASATVVSGVIKSINITNPGSGYITTPTITITDGSGSGAVVTVSGETSPSGGPALAKYVSKKVVLNAGFDSGDMNVFVTAYRPVNTDINVYYKILNRNDTQKFEDSSWQLMTKINASGSAFSQTRSDLYEYVFAPGPYTSGLDQGSVSYTSTNNGQVYTTFSQFAIKVVLTTTDNTSVPFATDLRVISLPPNINTTV